MADLATLEAQLAEAQLAYHQRLIGRKPTQVREADGSSVTYGDNSPASILAYMARLRGEIDALKGTALPMQRQPLLIRF